MRILARTQLRFSPVIVFLVALAIASSVGAHALHHGLASAVHASRDAIYRLRLDVEPAVVTGGLVVSRNRHTIAGAAMGCGTGAATGAGIAAVLGLASGGIALAALPPAAGLGCAVGAAGGIAIGYPLDSWALN